MKKNDYYKYNLPIEEEQNFGEIVEFKENQLKEEIDKFNKVLEPFNISIEWLVQESPTDKKQ